MKTKDKKALNELSTGKLYSKLGELKKEYVDLLLQQKIRKIKNLHAADQKRKEIARVKTFIRLKTLTQTQGESHGKNN